MIDWLKARLITKMYFWNRDINSKQKIRLMVNSENVPILVKSLPFKLDDPLSRKYNSLPKNYNYWQWLFFYTDIFQIR